MCPIPDAPPKCDTSPSDRNSISRTYLRCPSLSELPPAKNSASGWPWTEGSSVLPDAMPDGFPWPRVTLVTPSFNQGDYLEETIRSILLQGYPNLEYIIVDGGSSDGSVEVIKKYEPWLAYWVSEPDRGQAHAINKGVFRATGNIFNWINSDDVLARDALTRIVSALRHCDSICGDVEHFDEAGRRILVRQQGVSAAGLLRCDHGVLWQQPGFWTHLDDLIACGGIDEQFHFSFDWDMAIRYLSRKPNVCYIHDKLANFRRHMSSKTVSQKSSFREDDTRVALKILGMPEYSTLHAACRLGLRRRRWLEQLHGLVASDSSSGLVRAAHIAFSACRDPIVRWNRYTLGTMVDACFPRVACLVAHVRRIT